jgi:hypothetical protein
MQYKISIPNERNLNCEKDCAKVSGKWRELNIYQHTASMVLIPFVMVAFWRGSWGLFEVLYCQFFRPVPTLIASTLVCLLLELIRPTFISKHLKILDDDSRVTVLKKNILLSFYDIIFNLSNVAFWVILWGHPEGKFKMLLFSLREQIRLCL